MSGSNSGLEMLEQIKPLEPEWRKSRPGISPKLLYVLQTKKFTDVTFRVGSGMNVKTFYSHRFVLSLYSSVFEAMFKGPLAASNDEIIDLPDIEPQSFKILLKFIYSGYFSLRTSVDVALGVLYATNKYDIPDLESVCSDCLKSQIQYTNAVSILQTAQLLDVLDLGSKAFAFIIQNFDQVLQTEDFLNIHKCNLRLFVKDDDIAGSEIDIFLGILRWAAAECTRNGLDQDPSNLRLVMDDIMYLIRFPIMQSGVLKT